MHKSSWLGLSVIILISLSYSIYADATPSGALELNLTFPLLRYTCHAGGNLDLFVGAGYPVMANAGLDIYPWGGNKNFYLQLDCPLTYQLTGHIPESDEDYVPGADYSYQLIMPGVALGWKLHFTSTWFCRLGVGGSNPINIGSGFAELNPLDGILAYVKLQMMIGLEL